MAVLVTLTSASPVIAADQSSTLSTKGWTISISWTNPNQPSGGATTISMTVNVFETVYNLQISVTGQDLTINSNQGSGNTYSWDQLNQGDSRQVQFIVSTPTQAPVGNKYNVTVAAQSYATPAGAFGLRQPFDSPNNKDSTSFILQVVPVVVIPVQGSSGGIDWGTIGVIGFVVIVLAVLLLYLWSRQY